MKPNIATTLDNGDYGVREMTDAEHVDYLAAIANASPIQETPRLLLDEPADETPSGS
jgi:hypothetical protein